MPRALSLAKKRSELLLLLLSHVETREVEEARIPMSALSFGPSYACNPPLMVGGHVADAHLLSEVFVVLPDAVDDELLHHLILPPSSKENPVGNAMPDR